MFHSLKNHPFAIEAFFESSLVLTFAVPKEELEHMIPECMKLDTFDDKWAFIAMAMVQTTGLRPKGFPEFLGNNFLLIGYRVFVTYINKAGKRLRGLYILGSQTNKRKMEFLGNIFTKYHYTTTDIKQTQENNKIEIKSAHSKFRILVEILADKTPLPQKSPFIDWKQARRFAGPLPFTFTYTPQTKEVLIIEGVRQNWNPCPVMVLDFNISFLENLNLKEVRLANAFIINNIPYYWKRGKKEKWNS